ncbi:hypothetical protein [Streptobacillus moniliformis]|uniref:hypothetical protein n=1 Tax=Streptobacillus moniliformis TaxID=34105 RepID=UPI0007E45697|nr:hypothetical protein [Streptobacillus moniliformis]
MRDRNFINGGIFEKANAISTIRQKRLEEMEAEDVLNVLDVSLERLEALRDSVKGNGIKEREIKNSIEDAIDETKRILHEQTEILERKIPYEMQMELLKDHDGDGLSTKEELERGLDPFSKDSDGNGIEDFDEVNLTEVEKQRKLEEDKVHSIF